MPNLPAWDELEVREIGLPAGLGPPSGKHFDLVANLRFEGAQPQPAVGSSAEVGIPLGAVELGWPWVRVVRGWQERERAGELVLAAELVTQVLLVRCWFEGGGR